MELGCVGIMILPTYTDEETLKELMDDWTSVKRQTKKLGKELLGMMPKGRIGMNKDKFLWIHGKHITKNGNYWSIGVYCVEGTTQWWSVFHCEVENDYGTKSYFYLRGMNTPHQYYVEVIPHAVRRIRERYINSYQEAFFADMKAEDVVDLAIFNPHDCGIFFKAGKMRKGVFYPFTDGDGNIPGVIYLKHSMFYARMTPLGNFIFKTFIVPDAEEGTPKREFILMLAGIYLTHNMPKGEDTVKKRAEKLAAVWHVLPKMRHHIDHFEKKVVPLYP